MNLKKNDVSVVIPNYNGEELLKKNLKQIVGTKSDYGNQILEIIIVDDGSTDGSVKFIKDNFSDIRLVRHKINRGVASAINTGVRSSKGDLILLLSTDVVPDKNFLGQIFPHFQNPKVFAVSLHEKGCGWERAMWKDGYIQNTQGLADGKVHSTFYVKKGSGVFNRKIWIELGGMDEKLMSPFSGEDIDICYRASKRGYQILWEPNAHVVHEHWGTIGKFPKSFVKNIIERNQLIFIWKNIHSTAFVRKHLVGIAGRTLRHPGYVRILFMALAKIGIILKARNKERKESRVSDEAIFSRSA